MFSAAMDSTEQKHVQCAIIYTSLYPISILGSVSTAKGDWEQMHGVQYGVEINKACLIWCLDSQFSPVWAQGIRKKGKPPKLGNTG